MEGEFWEEDDGSSDGSSDKQNADLYWKPFKLHVSLTPFFSPSETLQPSQCSSADVY